MTPGNLCTCINEPDAVRRRAAPFEQVEDAHAQHRNAEAVTEAEGIALVPGADNAMLRARFASFSLKDLGRAAASIVAVVRAALE